LDGGEVIDVRRAGLADLGRHAGFGRTSIGLKETAPVKSSTPAEAPVFIKRYRSLIRAEL
ncbi:hypothetical protein, partial [Mesorhizobium sp. M1A.F.Ca.IN.020.03.2.1]|uniref:hypothetical protein n=1 Tax=Mesorhizobium sp. M1A.F.Ca.IN.020.03.2.1 TaxID=2496769 RepID=UPI0019D49505